MSSKRSPESKLVTLSDLVTAEILPWPAAAPLIPSHKQWADLNEEHETTLRCADVMMRQTKGALANFAGKLERAGKIDEHLAMYDRSMEFFADMQKVLEAAKLRLMVGAVVYESSAKQKTVKAAGRAI